MAFQSDKQRKGFFASQNKPKSTSIRDTKTIRDKNKEKRLIELRKEREIRTKTINEKYDREANKLDLQNEPTTTDCMMIERDRERELKELNAHYDMREKNVETTNYDDVKKLEEEKKERAERKYYDEGVLGTDKEHKARIEKRYREKKWDKRLSYKGEPNEIEVRELELYTENDSQLYNSQKKYIDANLDKKKANGTYTRKGAEVSYLNLTNASAKKYEREEAGRGQVFTKADKVQVAKNLAESHEREYDATHK